LAFFGIIDRTSYTGPNYRTKTIIIVHLATLERRAPVREEEEEIRAKNPRFGSIK